MSILKRMKKEHLPKFICLYFCMAGVFLSACQTRSQTPEADREISQDLYANLEFDMPRVVEPSFPDHTLSITDFGAVGDGQALNTQAFTDAIAAVAAQGGGKVVVPAGIWLTGPITLKSNINLHTEKGALVVFSDNFDLYPLVETSFEGLNTIRCISPINGVGLENVAITGEGIFDGSGDAWRPVKKSKMTAGQWKGLLASGGVLNQQGDIWYPTEKALRGAEMSEMNVPENLETKADFEQIRDYLRPVMVSIVKSKKVLLDGPTFQNSPAWCIHPLMCEDVTIRNLTVKNPWYSQNGDGLDLESCKNVVIHDNNFDVGDDAICFKSGKNEDGRERGMPTENVIVKHNVVYHGHGGFVVGSEMSRGVKNVHVSHCTFIGTDVGLRFKSTRGRGGVVENIYISNIDMINIPTEPLLFDLYYTGNSPIPEPEQSHPDKEKLAAMMPPVTEETPQFKNITVKNIVCKGAGRALFLQGLPEMNLENVSLENIQIVADKGGEVIDAKDIRMKNVQITTRSGPALLFRNAKNVQLHDFDYQTDGGTAVQVEGIWSENIQLEKTDFENSNQQILLGKNVEKEAIVLHE